VARDPADRGHHALVERRLAELVGGKIDIDPDDLDHVPAQDREVLFLHRDPSWRSRQRGVRHALWER
jgi:hypothetical protein